MRAVRKSVHNTLLLLKKPEAVPFAVLLPVFMFGIDMPLSAAAQNFARTENDDHGFEKAIVLHAGRSRFVLRSAQRCRQGKCRLSKRLFCAFGLRVWLIEEAKCNNLKAKNAQKARLIDELCNILYNKI